MPVIALIIGVLLAATDQIIKYFVLTYLQPVGSVTAIDGLLDFTYVENRGVAFGMFSDMRWFFVAVTAVLIAIIIYIMFKKKPSGKMFYISAALIIGGGIGNLIDRIFYGFVVDYISVSFFPPVCNFADYCITEAGFGSDLGAEKFLDIKCRYAGIAPSAIVIVATCRALKYNGGVPKSEVSNENIEALKKGIVNLGVHIDNMRKYNVPVVVAINQFGTDTDEELKYIEEYCISKGADFALSNVFGKGGEGGVELANKVVEACEKPSAFKPLYSLDLTLKEKVEKIAKEIYGASKVNYTTAAEKAIKEVAALGGDKLPICVAKTQYSLSDDPTKLGAPKDFEITVRDVTISNGAGFAVIYTGNIMTMPGLPKVPAAEKINIDENGKISGLF